jgi:hypothetical protein
MFELLDIVGAYKSSTNHMIVEKYCDLQKNENIYILYINNTNINNTNEDDGDNDNEETEESITETEEIKTEESITETEEIKTEESITETEESGSESGDDIIEYKWYENNSRDINNLLNFLKREGGSYYDENNEILYGPDISNISRDVSYEISSYEKGFRNKYHDFCFDEVPVADKDLSLILNEIYGTIII